jgi:hypothetical protein
MRDKRCIQDFGGETRGKETNFEDPGVDGRIIQGVQLKSGPYFNMSNLFTKIYNMLYYTTNLHLQ